MRALCLWLAPTAMVLFKVAAATADQNFYQVFLKIACLTNLYFYSSGSISKPSMLRLVVRSITWFKCHLINESPPTTLCA